MKIARHAYRSAAGGDRVFDHAYHGRTNLTMALTAKNMPYKQGFGAVRRARSTGCRWPTRCAGPAGRPECGPGRRAGHDQDLADPHPGRRGERRRRDDRADPGRGRLHRPAGRLPHRRCASFCDRHGILLIADEIQTGFCRTGDWFACEHEGVVPDLITTAKGIAGGFPLSRGDRPRVRSWIRCTAGGTGRHLRRQSGRLRRRPGRDRDDDESEGPGGERGPAGSALSWQPRLRGKLAVGPTR